MKSALTGAGLLLGSCLAMPAAAQTADPTLSRLERTQAEFEDGLSSVRSCTDAVQSIMKDRTGKATAEEARAAFAGDALAPELLPVERACKDVRNTLSAGGGVDAQRARLAAAIAKRKKELEPKPDPTPEPLPAKKPDAMASPLGLVGMAPIASEFDVMAKLQKSWGHGRPAPANTAATGDYRMLCGAGTVKDVDNIVSWGKPSSHTHQLVGNEGTESNSNYADLRTSGASSCGNEVWRTNYWMPVMLNGKGQIVAPEYVLLYYKRRPKSDPKCQAVGGVNKGLGICVDMPNGMRIVEGYNFTTGKTSGLHFSCASKDFKNLEDMQADPSCTPDKDFLVTVTFPTCWDGKNLDSADNRSHMAWPSYGSWGYERCPSSHPYVVPRLEQKYHFSQVAGEVYSYASDRMVPGIKRGATGHADFFEAVDPIVKAMFHDNCIDKRLNCSGGDLGNGWQIKGATQPRYGFKNPQRTVPIPATEQAKQDAARAGHVH